MQVRGRRVQLFSAVVTGLIGAGPWAGASGQTWGGGAAGAGDGDRLRGACSCVTGAAETDKLTTLDAEQFDQFGWAVAIAGDTALIGAVGDAAAGSGSGSAYVFVRDPGGTGTWTQQAKLTAMDAAASDLFGIAVSLDGDTAIVGAVGDNSSAGSAYVFVRSAGLWTQQFKLTASDAAAGDGFGGSVSISGETVLVGANSNDDVPFNSGSAYIFVRSGSVWMQQAKLTASDAGGGDLFGYSVSLSGNTAVISATGDDDRGTNAGAVYVFQRSGTSWSQAAKLTAGDGAPSDEFGYSVSVSNGTTLIGARSDDDAGGGSGSAYVFVQSGPNWVQQAKLTALDAATGDSFGYSVSIAGDAAVVGSVADDDDGTNSGSLYLFLRCGTEWEQGAKLTASDAAAQDAFGNAVAIAGNAILVGVKDDDDAGSSSGAVYVFEIDDVDNDGVADNCDNCPLDPNGNQADADEDGVGDVCDLCPLDPDSDQADADQDGVGDICDNCPLDPNGNQADADEDGEGDVCDACTDSDGDGFGDPGYSANTCAADICPAVFDPLQADEDGDGTGDACECELGALELDKLLASDGTAGDEFGRRMAVDGDTSVIGAAFDDDAGASSGSAYVFVRSGMGWEEQAKLAPLDPAAGDQFGLGVAISEDTIIVAAPGDDDGGSSSGSAYVFVRVGATWIQQAKLTALDAATDDLFGSWVAVLGDTAVVGAAGDDDRGESSGSAYVFVRSGSTWTQRAKLTALDGVAGALFGTAVAISGDTAVVTARLDPGPGGAGSGSAYVFTGSDMSWSQQAKLNAIDSAAGDEFGTSASISGSRVLIGTRFDDDAGDRSGSAYVFVRSGGTWSQEAKLTASDATALSSFGVSIALAGHTAVVGAFESNQAGASSGAAYLFVRTGSSWFERQKLTPSDAQAGDLFGSACAVAGDSLLIGARSNLPQNSGSAYAFEIGIFDVDVDGFPDLCDNCRVDPNADQSDGDLDFVGDQCDNCPFDPNTDQLDSDQDGVGDACDPCPQPGYTVTACAHALEDISSTGTLAPNASSTDDSPDLDIPIGFSFPFFNHSYTTIHISPNGCAGFDPSGIGSFFNLPIPDPGAPNNLICPLWDDFVPNVAGDVYYQTLSNPTRFVVQWHMLRRIGATTGANTFQAILFPGGKIEYRYGAIEGSPPLTASVGVENGTGEFGATIDPGELATGQTCRLLEAFRPCGACCLTSGGCEVREVDDCPSQSGQYQGDGTTCADGDSDGVADLCDLCPGDPGDDFETFILCMEGPGASPVPPGCACADLDADGDVDLADFVQFQR